MNRQNIQDAKLYRFAGHSDDVFGEEETGFYCGGYLGEESSFSLRRPNGEGVLITGQYRENGCWHIGVSLLDESRPLVLADGWKFSLLPTSYNNELLVYAPADAELTCLDDEEDSDD
mgnify:FL=1